VGFTCEAPRGNEATGRFEKKRIKRTLTEVAAPTKTRVRPEIPIRGNAGNSEVVSVARRDLLLRQVCASDLTQVPNVTAIYSASLDVDMELAVWLDAVASRAAFHARRADALDLNAIK